MRGDKFAEVEPARVLLLGYPGAGKTGSLACLANAGFKLRVLDFDGNLKPLLQFTRPECRANIDILSFEDRTRQGPKYIEPVGIPEAFANALRAMDHWKYKEEDGTEVDLGHSRDWGLDTIVVLDSLTSMGQAAFRRAMVLQNKTPGNITDQVWGLAMNEQEAFIEKLTSTQNGHHVIVLSHLVMVGPKEIRKGDDEITKGIKETLADLIPTRLYPSALGQKLPPKIGAHFPCTLLLETEVRQKQVRHVIRSLPRPELDLKLPAVEALDGVAVEDDGMLKVFKALGCEPPAVAGGKVAT